MLHCTHSDKKNLTFKCKKQFFDQIRDGNWSSECKTAIRNRSVYGVTLEQADCTDVA